MMDELAMEGTIQSDSDQSCFDDSVEANRENELEQELENIENKKKKKLQKKYPHKFQIVWQKEPQFKNWIKPSDEGINYFWCDYCKKSYKAGKSEVLRHFNSKKHCENAAKYDKSQKVLSESGFNMRINVEKKVKINEIKIASFCAEHNLPFTTSEHLVKLIQSMHLEKEVTDSMTCGRTKCRALIVNCIGQYSLECLVKILRETKFSIMIDELTDKSSVKILSIVVRFFGKNGVEDRFLDSKEVPIADTEHLHSEIVKCFTENKIPYKDNMIGFAADGASVMMGAHHSVSQALKDDIPFLFVFKCLCHSFSLAACEACKKLPNSVENLVRLVYTYMHRSFKRLCEFKEFQQFLDLKPQKLLQPSQTRWLSLILAVQRVREQYPALKMYFASEHLNKQDDDSSATSIHELLSNPINKLYLDFLSHSLPLFTDLNKEFQSEKTKIHLLYGKVSQVYKTLLDCYLKRDYLNRTAIEQLQFRNPEHFVQLEDVYLGPAVAIALAQNAADFDRQDLHYFRLNCLNFYIEGARQIYQRFPFNSPVQKALSQMNILDPAYFKANRPPTAALLITLFPPNMFNIESLESQWRLFRNDPYVDSQKSDDFYEFWIGMSKILNNDGSCKYGVVFELVKSIAILPHSSAAVERFFSQVNLNKTKLRNSLDTGSVTGILLTKGFINTDNCYDYEIPNDMILKHNAKMY